MNSSRDHYQSGLSLAGPDELSALCEQFDREWTNAPSRPIESWLQQVCPEQQGELLTRLLGIELAHRALIGEKPTIEEYLARFPDFREFVESQFQWLMTATQIESHTASKSSTALFGKIAHAIRPESSHQPGHVVGRYQLQERVGYGGFGEVWRAHDPELTRTVAIKLLRSDRKHSELAVDLRAEARRAASLTHRHIVPVYDIAQDDGGVYIVSEFIAGKTLADRLARGKPSIAESIAVAVQVADALHHAHLAGFVHRDVKPSNILLRDNGEAVLADFGLATSEADQLHESGGAMGTWKYMSPEQARGESNRCDARTDVYSLGIVLFELLTGRLPYVGEDQSSYIEQVLTREPRLPRTINDAIPPDLERIVMRCMAKSPGDRFSTCAELAESLRRSTFQESAAARLVETQGSIVPTTIALPSRPRRSALVGAGFVGVTVVIGATVLLVPRERTSIQVDPIPPAIEARGGGTTTATLATLEAQQQNPPRLNLPVDPNWVSLLESEPVMVAWGTGDGREPPVFDAASKKYRVRSDRTTWIAKAGSTSTVGFELRTVLSVADWTGRGGVVWGLRFVNSFPDQELCCLAVEFTRAEPGGLAALELCEYTLKQFSFDDIRIVRSQSLDKTRIEVPTKDSAPLVVSVRESELMVMFDDIPWRPKTDQRWYFREEAAVGMTGCWGEVGFRELAVRNEN